MIINNSVFFIHIPRTGGRYIKKIIQENNSCEEAKYENHFLKKNIERYVQVPHLDFPYYEALFNFKPLKKFTIVREPVDRFISMLRTFDLTEQQFQFIFKDQETLDRFINDTILCHTSNWFLPQINFLGNNINVWKYENKFNDTFFNWLNKEFNIVIGKTNLDYIKEPTYDNNKKYELNTKQKNLIKNYYYKDYKILNY